MLSPPDRTPTPQLYDQEKLLPKRQLLIVFSALASALLVTFIDQNSIGVALPAIGGDLHAANTISWAGTSNLIANATFQVLYGRLSDIFGRKIIFLSAVGLLAIGDLACGFAQTGPQLYAFRGISGIGSAGITALTMMIVSDIVTLRERGKYQGILGSCVGLGNTIGPFLAAAFVEKSTWRALFWCISPLAVLSGAVTLAVLPSKRPRDSLKEKVKKIDFLGSLFSTAGIILLLIPISGGGTYFEWKSPMVIVMLNLGGMCMVLFLLVEWKVAQLPTMPLRLFRNKAVCAILVQNFLFGMVYYAVLYYVPLYFQDVRGFSPLASAGLVVLVVIGQSFASIGSGQYISRRGRYGELLWVGYGLWTLGAGLRCLFSRTLPIPAIAVILFIEGLGVGNCFQPTLIASQAHCFKADRAVIISTRNFCRTLGGATGLAAAAGVFSNVLQSRLPSGLSHSFRQTVTSSIFKIPDLSSLSAIEKNGVLDAYMAASRAVFIMWVPIMGICFCSCIFVEDRGLKRPDEVEAEQEVALVQEEIRRGQEDETASSYQLKEISAGKEKPISGEDVAFASTER